jgi:hypothetical protein
LLPSFLLENIMLYTDISQIPDSKALLCDIILDKRPKLKQLLLDCSKNQPNYPKDFMGCSIRQALEMIGQLKQICHLEELDAIVQR